MRGRPNALQAAGRDAGLKLMEIRRLRDKGLRITVLERSAVLAPGGAAMTSATPEATLFPRLVMPERAERRGPCRSARGFGEPGLPHPIEQARIRGVARRVAMEDVREKGVRPAGEIEELETTSGLQHPPDFTRVTLSLSARGTWCSIIDENTRSNASSG